MKKIYLAIIAVLFFFVSTVNAQVVINEVYGGGGNAGATYKNDFIELFNNGASPVSLAGWSVQYASAAGTSWAVTNLSGSIPAHGHYLIQEALGAGGTTNLPAPDATGTIAMSATTGKVVLCNVTTAQAGANPTGVQIIDKVGFGSTANGFEGSGPTATLTNTTSAQRNPEGFDSNNNSSDFGTISAPSPANASGGADVTPPTISSLFPANGATNVITSFTATISFSETVQKGTSGTITIKKVSDNSVSQTLNITSPVITVSGSAVIFDVSSLAFATAYYVEISAGAFKDLSNNNFAGITGSGTWSFITAATPPPGTPGTTYSFNICGTTLPDGFTQYDKLGDQKWACTTFGRDAANLPSGSAPNGMQINGFLVTNIPNEDWLITPAFNLTGTIYPLLSFWSRTKFNGAPLQLKISTDYSGSGNPGLATWTDLNGKFPNQTSDVWTLSPNINLSAFKQPKIFIAFVYTSSADDGARWTLDDISIINSATPPPASITTSTTDVQFTYVASGATADKTFSFTGNDITTDVTLSATSNFLLSKDGTSFSSSVTYTIADANNIAKTVYVRFAPTQKDLNYTGTVAVSTSGLTATVNVKGTSIDPAGTLEVVNWNMEWFGSTDPTLGPTNDNLQEQNAKIILQNIGADIYGLVEVVDETRLAHIVSQMPGYSYIICNYGSHVNPPDPSGGPLSEAQKEAFVYKTSMFSNITTRALINNQNIASTSYNSWASGRYPFLMTADVTLNCVTKKINFVLIHAKANTSPTATSYARRQAAATELHDTLMTYFPTDKVIILGDFNDDLDQSITDGFTTTSYSAFTTDNANFFSPTLALSLAGKKSTVSFNDVIDHVMLTNDMQPYYMPSTASILTDVSNLVSNYGSTTTDHYPVFTRYAFEKPAAPVITSCPAISPLCENNNGSYTIPAFTAISNCGSINYSYEISGATVRSGTTNNASGSFNVGSSTITWTATDGLGSTSTCQTAIVINASPVVTIHDAYALSSGVLPNTVYIGYMPASSLTLTSVVSGGSIPYSYSWSNGSVISSTSVSPTTTTTYSLTVTDANGCQGVASKTVAVLDIRSGKKMDKVIICHRSSTQNSIQIDPNAVIAHLAHGDMLGNCAATAPSVTTKNITGETSLISVLAIKAQPNPSANYFTISVAGVNGSEKLSLRVTDILGRTMEQKDNLQNNRTYNVGSAYSPGVYIVELIQGAVRKQIKLLKSSE